MDAINAKDYNKTNELQRRDGKELIERIVAENSDQKYDIVVDIGCGSGNITLLLNGALNVNQIYAIDVDNDMIAFAKQNHSKDNIKYFAQDFGVDWDQLTPELQSIEGRVSLIFSNHCLHWISNKKNVAKNLYRLLSKSGKIYTNIYWISDLFLDLSPEEKAIHDKEVMQIPTTDEQLNVWLDEFRNAGFVISSNEFIRKDFTYDRNVFIEGVLPLSLTIRRIYFVDKDFGKNKTKFDEFFRKVWNKCRQFTDETTGQELVEFKYGFFQFLLHK